MSTCFGIDLGTTCSTIGWVHQGTPRLLRIGDSALVPSVVHLPRTGPAEVGAVARNQLLLDPDRTFASTKTEMGTNRAWALPDRVVRPVDVAAEILRHLAEGAQQETGEEVRRVVITVPAWFTQAQRADTRAAGAAAGLDVVRILNEPTAAALAHAHGRPQRRTVLVYDFGGGTFDVSVVRQDGDVVEVLASRGDSHLGGDDIDQALTAHFLTRLEAADPPAAARVREDAGARVRLGRALEEAKQRLSSEDHTVVRVPFLGEAGSPGVELGLTRVELEEVATPFIERTLQSVEAVLVDADLEASELAELLLVGGSTRLVSVWQRLHARFGLEGSHAIEPRDAVGLGAAIQAAIVDGSRVDGILVDVAPYSLSVGAVGDPWMRGHPTHFACRTLTPRNTPLPSNHTETFCTGHPNQPGVEIPVFQGSSPDPSENVLLGQIRIRKLEPAPPGEPNRPIRVNLRHDLDGMVTITVTDVFSGRTEAGEVAADGEAQDEQWIALLQGLEDDGIILGDGVGRARVHRDSIVEETDEHSSSTDEAKQTFLAVLAAAEQLRAEHGEAGEALVALAQQGSDLLEGGAPDEALVHHEALSDQLFDLAIFL